MTPCKGCQGDRCRMCIKPNRRLIHVHIAVVITVCLYLTYEFIKHMSR